MTPAALLVIASLLPSAFTVDGKKKEKALPKLELSSEAKDSVKFHKDLKDAKIARGLMNTYIDKKGKLFLEIPDSLFDRTLLLVNRVNSLSRTSDWVAGQMASEPMLIRFSKDDHNVLLHLVSSTNVVADDDPIRSSYDLNFIDPVLKGFKIAGKGSGTTFIDATAFFAGNEKSISPIKESNPLVKALGGKEGIKGTFYADGSGLVSAKAFPLNVEIKSRLAYTTATARNPYTVTMSRSIVMLPEKPMVPRLHDKRVGYFSEYKNLYSSNEDGSRPYEIINRHRLEPREEDMEAYFRGELVEPKKKIVFYVDSAFPEKWRGAVKEGIEYWNKAFEAAGFKNAIEARDYPKDDPDFDPDDIRYSCIRYSVSPTANAMGPSYTDPRSGEIIGADVIWYHNILQLVHDWRFSQTAAVDPRVRTKTFADSVMYESLTYVAAHEVGHCLGLMHNMGASYSFTLDNLRDPAFTQKHGTTPSIMDYARNNFVAQPGDLERGVRLTPPPIGVYDIYAINWGYRLIPGAKTMEDEKPTLDAWIKEKAGDKMYEFGAQQFMGMVDPTDQTEDLGNDHIKAGDMSISNLKIIMSNFEDWAGDPGAEFEPLQDKYKAMVSQYLRHVSHVYPYIGGVVFKEIRQGEGDKAMARSFIPKADQRRAMNWLLGQARTSDWMTPPALMAKFEEPYQWRDKMLRNIVSCLLIPTNLQRIKEGGNFDPKANYTLPEYMKDAMAGIFDATYKGRPLNDTERTLQQTAIDVMTKFSGLKTEEKKASAKAIALDADEEFELTVNSNFSGMGCDLYTPGSCDFDADRSFFRILMNQPTLPLNELRPLMTAQLKKVMTLYKTKRALTADPATRDFYDYQIIQISRLFEK